MAGLIKINGLIKLCKRKRMWHMFYSMQLHPSYWHALRPSCFAMCEGVKPRECVSRATDRSAGVMRGAIGMAAQLNTQRSLRGRAQAQEIEKADHVASHKWTRSSFPRLTGNRSQQKSLIMSKQKHEKTIMRVISNG